VTTGVARRARHVVAAAAAAFLVSVAGAGSQPCAPARPEVNKPGFRAGAIVRWTFGDSPGGTPFPEEMQACVARAFEAWTAANHTSGLHVRFTPGHGGIIVRFDKPGGLILAHRHAGAWTDGVRAADGALERACIWITSDPSLVTACDAVTKIVLHELGHLHGLADNRRNRGPSVMNNAGGPDDHRGRLPFHPTECDALQAVAAATPGPRLLLARQRR
jgi:hypothetical protein